MIKFLNIDSGTLTQAIENCGWTKSVELKSDGTLDWFNETDFPSDSEIYAQIDLLVPNWTHDQAVARLAQYELSVGKPEVTESVVIGTESYVNEETMEDAIRDITEEIVISEAIDPLPATITVTTYEAGSETPTIETIENPLITKDKEERAWAQSVLDA